MDAACRQIVDCLVMNVLKLEQKAVEVSEGKVCYKLTLFYNFIFTVRVTF